LAKIGAKPVLIAVEPTYLALIMGSIVKMAQLRERRSHELSCPFGS
jgi:hypothetical protein